VTEAIVCQGLSKAFGDIVAVDSIDLDVHEGEIFGLVGPDGAGKSTTIRMLTTILPPTSGTATVMGHDIVTARDEIRGRIGYMSQTFNLYGDLTVGENLDFYADLYGVRGPGRVARRAELLEFSRLGPFVGRAAQYLSGGMKQKLALACNLIHEPKLLFLDEPTTGVDPISRREFWRILSDLHSTGATLVISTPYMDEAERCDRVAFLDGGRLTTVATPGEITARLAGMMIEIVAEPRRQAREVIARLASVEDVELYGDRLQAKTRDIDAASTEISSALEDAGIQVTDLRPVPPSMESAFVDLAKDRPS
jgi:ABC-2 type transport system ATP-binding protein